VSRHAGKLVLGLCALLLLGWLFRQSTQVNVAKHVRIVQYFEQLREQDARLSQYVLQSRYGLLHNYDPIVATQHDANQVVLELGRSMPEAFMPGGAPIQLAFAQYREKLDSKAQLLESFKSHNAVLSNSVRYLPVAVKLQYARFAAQPSQVALLHDLLENVLLFNQNTNDSFKAHVLQTVATMRAGPYQNDAAMQSLLQHAGVILAHAAEVDRLALAITQSQTVAQADRVFAQYNADFAQRDHVAGHYRLAMALLAATIILYVAWLLVHLQRARDTLADSMRELEFQKNALDKHAIVSVTDRTGKILYTNDKFSEVSQYSRTELLGQDHRLLNSGKHPSTFFKAMWATIGRGQIWQGEVLNRRKDGSLYWVDSTIAPFMDEQNKPLRYVSIRADITARKESEAAMLQAKTDAEEARSVAERARFAAEQANKIKSDFLANMSHEIRTPMNGIIGMTNLALETQLTAEQTEFLSIIKTGADSLLQVINDILDFSKMESGKLDIECIAFSLKKTLQDTVKAVAVRADQKQLDLRLQLGPDVPDLVMGDPGRLRQVLLNLVGNAIKFTARGEVVLEVQRQAGDALQVQLRFSVHDTGVGIAAEKFQTIFESFSQADTSTTRQYGGTGLGLSISSQIVQLMGSRIELRSQEGHGSTFHFTLELPLASAEALAQAADHAAHPAYGMAGKPAARSPICPMRPMRLLLAEDNAVNQMLARRLLENQGHTVMVANNGKEALEQWSAATFDAILMDVDMPEMGGYEATERIRAQEAGTERHIQIVAMTAHAMRGAREECLAHGMDGYLAKPIDTELLQRELEHLAQLAGQLDSSDGPADSVVADFDKARATMDNNRELFEEIVQQYLQDAPVQLRKLQDAQAQGNLAAMRQAAHALRGMASVFSAQHTVRCAHQLEQCADSLQAAELVSALESAMQQLALALTSYSWHD
jgi:PAS domain S-box-containing protein